MKKLTIVVALIVVSALGLYGQGQGNQDPWAPATFNNFKLRSVGPALMSGRISVITVHPEAGVP